jgi:hypothetical protein
LKNRILLNLYGLILVSILFFSCSEKKEKNDLILKNLKGRVESIQQFVYMVSLKLGKVQKDTLISKSVLKFNNTGYKIEESYYKANGSIDNQSIYEYDGNNNLIEDSGYEHPMVCSLIPSLVTDENSLVRFNYKYTYKDDKEGNHVEINRNRDGIMVSKYFNKYDGNGKLIEMDEYTMRDSIGQKSIYRYSDNGKVIEEKWYTEDDKLTEIHIEKCDDNGNCIEESTYNKDSALEFKQAMEYDNIGNKILITIYKKDGTVGYTYAYRYNTFDNYTNWLSSIYYKNDKPTTITERIVNYYKN